MPLFQCSACGCVENTALSNYWLQFLQENPAPVCTACDPGIKKWHGEFARRNAVDDGYLLGEDGFLYGPEERPQHTSIMSPVRIRILSMEDRMTDQAQEPADENSKLRLAAGMVQTLMEQQWEHTAKTMRPYDQGVMTGLERALTLMSSILDGGDGL